MSLRKKTTSQSFEGKSIFIGIDVHKRSWAVTIIGQEYEHKSMSQNPDPDILAKYLFSNFPNAKYFAAYEAGFCGFGACRRLNELGVNCSVIHAPDIPTSHKEKVQKTDKLDSKKIARALRNKEIEGIDIPPPNLEADRSLIRQRFRLVRDIARTKNRMKSLLFQFGIDYSNEFSEAQARLWTKTYINWLKTLPIENNLKLTINNYIQIGEFQKNELLIVNKAIRGLAKSETYKNNYELLKSIPGIGIISAITFLVQIGDINRFNRLDDLCSYIGLIPRMHNSGDTVKTGRIINRGRKELKTILIEASWQAVRKDPALMLKFEDLSKRMIKNKAIIRIARKLLSRIRYVLINQKQYELGVIN